MEAKHKTPVLKSPGLRKNPTKTPGPNINPPKIPCRIFEPENSFQGFHMTSLKKIQTKKLSILPRFYFYDALEQLKTTFHQFTLQKGSWFCDRVRLNF